MFLTIVRRTAVDVSKWLATNEVSLTGQNLPAPILNFRDAKFPPPIVDMLERKYETPTVIQSISWPVALEGRDLISIARTGSGKTLGFILPAIAHALKQPKRPPFGGPSGLVMLPTRYALLQGFNTKMLFQRVGSTGSGCDS
jgi:superfamily II DNA/RNA helicase